MPAVATSAQKAESAAFPYPSIHDRVSVLHAYFLCCSVVSVASGLPQALRNQRGPSWQHDPHFPRPRIVAAVDILLPSLRVSATRLGRSTQNESIPLGPWRASA